MYKGFNVKKLYNCNEISYKLNKYLHLIYKNKNKLFDYLGKQLS